MTYVHIGDAERQELLFGAPHGRRVFPEGSWVLERSTTQVSVEVVAWGVHTVSFGLRLDEGVVEVDHTGEISYADISVCASSTSSGSARRDTRVRGRRFLDVERHPRITFCGRGSRELLVGILTVKHDSTPLTLTATQAHEAADGRAVFSAEGTVDRRNIGLGYLPAGVFGTEVTIRVRGVARPR